MEANSDCEITIYSELCDEIWKQQRIRNSYWVLKEKKMPIAKNPNNWKSLQHNQWSKEDKSRKLYFPRILITLKLH